MKFGYLCGLLIDYDEFKETSDKEKHPMHIKKLEQHELKMINDEFGEERNEAEMEEVDTCLRVDISSWILADMIEEMTLEMVQLKG